MYHVNLTGTMFYSGGEREDWKGERERERKKEGKTVRDMNA